MSDVQGNGFADYEPTARPVQNPTLPVQVRRLAATEVTACAVLDLQRRLGCAEVTRQFCFPERRSLPASTSPCAPLR